MLARRQFRVEAMRAGRANGHAPGQPHANHHEIMSELRALRALVKPAEEVTAQMIDAYKAQIAEAAKLKSELDLIYDAINRRSASSPSAAGTPAPSRRSPPFT